MLTKALSPGNYNVDRKGEKMRCRSNVRHKIALCFRKPSRKHPPWSRRKTQPRRPCCWTVSARSREIQSLHTDCCLPRASPTSRPLWLLGRRWRQLLRIQGRSQLHPARSRNSWSTVICVSWSQGFLLWCSIWWKGWRFPRRPSQSNRNRWRNESASLCGSWMMGSHLLWLGTPIPIWEGRKGKNLLLVWVIK